MPAHCLQIDTFEQPVQLLGVQLKHRFAATWPREPVSFQAAQHEPESIALPQQQF